MFDKYQVEYNILTVVHKDVAENIREIYKDYQRKGWNYLQFITCLDPMEFLFKFPKQNSSST